MCCCAAPAGAGPPDWMLYAAVLEDEARAAGNSTSGAESGATALDVDQGHVVPAACNNLEQQLRRTNTTNKFVFRPFAACLVLTKLTRGVRGYDCAGWSSGYSR